MTACELPSLWVALISCLVSRNIPTQVRQVYDAFLLLLRLTAIRDYSFGMKLLQKKAFVKTLLQSTSVGNVSAWPPYFLTSILPLLPYLPVSHFQQLTSQQVRPHVKYSNTKDE